jgi:HlyD family secretion protein
LKALKRIVIFALLGAGGWYGWNYYQAQQAAEEEQGLGEVPTQAAAVRDITVSVSATGTLQPVRIVQVKSKAAGEILHMPVDLGDKVEVGDLIAQVDTEILGEELTQAKADLESAQTRLSVAERDYERTKDLHAEDLVSFRDLDNAEQTYTNAKGALLRAEAEVRVRAERLDEATVVAPALGTVIAKGVEEGMIIQSSTNSVQGGTTLVETADLSTLEVRTLVDEIDIGQVKAGLPVNITVEAYPSRRFRGEVIKIEPQAVLSQQVTTFPVLSRIDNADGLLLPGMNADVEVIIHRRPRVLTVPNESVKSMGDAGQVAELLGLPFDRDELKRDAAARDGGTEEPPAETAAGGEGGDGEEELSDGPIEFEKMRGMSREEREQYMAGFTEAAQKKFRDDMRARFSQMGGGGGGGGRPGGGAPGGSFGGGRGGGAEASAAGMDAFGIGRREEAVVFVMTADGQMKARQVTIGVQDWENTEVIAGLDDGDQVVLLPSTSLLMSQQALRERFSRFSRLPGT